MIEAYPSCWPEGYPRTKTPVSSLYRVTADKARKELLKEIELLSGDKKPIISSNVPLRKSDGQMYADVANAELHDNGVAVYFMMKGVQKVLACDKWITPAQNIRALSLTVNALRALPRHGASQILERAFSGLSALPAPNQLVPVKDIWKILGLTVRPTDKGIVEAAYKVLAKKIHPDAPTGSKEAFQELQDAYKQALSTY